MNGPCPDMQEPIADYVIAALDEEQAGALRSHLAGCDNCRRYLKDLQEQGQSLVGLGREIEAGASLRQDRVIQALEGVTPAGRREAPLLVWRLARMAVAAVLILGAGIVMGRLTAPQPVDIDRLRADVETSVLASLKPAVGQDLLTEVDRRVQAALSADGADRQAEIVERIRQDLRVFAAQLTAGSEARMDQRVAELVELIEAARRKDRQQVARALEQMKTKMGMGLYSLAARTSDVPVAVPN
ncbi:MAG: hypothetical protein JW741_21425 [Sedimentisphaerales bacterium]|nr:hypothetical protein [Sedimentisphaerales bacterium]